MPCVAFRAPQICALQRRHGVDRRRVCSKTRQKTTFQRLARVPLHARETEPLESAATTKLRGEVEEIRWVDSGDAVRSHGLLFAALLLGSFPSFYRLPFSQVPYFLSLASLSIYIGSHRSLNADIVEQVTFKQSLLAPVLASCFLFGFYLLTKYFPGFNIQTFIDIQFGVIGTFAVGRLLSPFLGGISVLSTAEYTLPEWLAHEEDGQAVRVSGADVIGMVIGLMCVLMDVTTGHHLHTLNNFLACSLAIEVLQGVGIKSFKAASVLLMGLLMYDVFWVFSSPSVIGENVMLKVATSNSIEGPLKLILPNGNGGETFPFSILGLGDIAIPGILAALMLRFDIFGRTPRSAAPPAAPDSESNEETGMCYAMESVSLPLSKEPASRTNAADVDPVLPERENIEEEMPDSKIYFLPVLASYALGLLLASGANAITNQGQPALLYIVPCMLLTASGIAVIRGEFWDRLFPYNDPAKCALQEHSNSNNRD